MEAPLRARGRPRGFDRDAALKSAMETFWALGYEGASMAELTRAMGLNSPSLYAAFGSKDALFRETLELYQCEAGAILIDALEGGATAREGVEAFLLASAEALTRPGSPPGCMIVLAAASAYGASLSARDAARTGRAGAAERIAARLERGIAAGDLSAGLDIAAISAFYVTVQQGMSIQAVDGASRDRLTDVARAAMSAWDGLTGTRTGASVD